MLNVETKTKIAELEIDYETEKKDLLIAQNELKIRSRNNQLLFSIGVILILLVVIIGVYGYQKFKREHIRKELEFRNRLKQADMHKKMSDEKIRIPRELHDNIGSQLTFLISSLDNLSYKEKSQQAISKLKNLSDFGRMTLKELRNTIWAMVCKICKTDVKKSEDAFWWIHRRKEL